MVLHQALLRLTRVQEASIFLKKRAVLEEDFGRTMHKLAATSQMAYTANECKAGYVYSPSGISVLHHMCARLGGGCDYRVIPKIAQVLSD
jgi:hypothetical protein